MNLSVKRVVCVYEFRWGQSGAGYAKRNILLVLMYLKTQICKAELGIMAAPIDFIPNNVALLIEIMEKICDEKAKLNAVPIDPTKKRKDIIREHIKYFGNVCSKLTNADIAKILIKYLDTKNTSIHMWWGADRTYWLESATKSPNIKIPGSDFALPLREVYRYCKEIDRHACEHDTIINTEKIGHEYVFLKQLFTIFLNAVEHKISQGTVVDGVTTPLSEDSIEFIAWDTKRKGCVKIIAQCNVMLTGQDATTNDFLSIVLDKILPVDQSTGQKITKKEILDIFKDKLGGNDESISSLFSVMPELINGSVKRDDIVTKIKSNKMLSQMMTQDQIAALTDGIADLSDKFFKKDGTMKQSSQDMDFKDVINSFDIDAFMSDGVSSSSAPTGKGKKK